MSLLKSYLDAEGPPDAPLVLPQTRRLVHQVKCVSGCWWLGFAPVFVLRSSEKCLIP